ncbi:S-layer homology domain-containing protein [Paenibacillus tyrfis]|uniref:S-layer homology domain-containing protein n=1 Tax=Paenibacillus tyrfis TaxID=1501230 RepID=UPI00209CB191|nr:S-layer homology domain-containing protein [Paenibacillus tyrfis]MCP1308547.1 S-layer homology domain-containing protein [Paenibacillus tyrfis]
MGGSVTIDGVAKAGQTLTANVTGITYTPDTTGNVSTYQWYRNGAAITNATGSSYTLTADDLGATITLTVTADDTHAVGSVTSVATAVVTKGDGPAAPSAPVASSVTPTSITLQPVSGQEYSMDGGLTWQDSPTFNGLTPSTDYTFVTRVKATATQMASAVSQATKIRTSVGEPVLEITEPASGTVTVSKPVFKGTAAPGSKVTVNIADGITGTVTADTYGNWSYTPEVNLADGTYTVKVTATKDGKSSTVSKDLTVNTADQSSLTGLQLNSWNGTPIGLSPAFNGSTTKYTASVTNSVYSVTLSSLPLDPNAKIEVSVNNGPWKQVPNGAASGNLPLNVGTNTIVIKVTDAKGKVTEYTLTITRESSDSGDSDSSSGGSTTTPSTSTGSSSSGASTTPSGSGIETSVNGKDDTFATGKESTSGDRKVTSVQVDLDKLNKALSQGNGQKLAIHSSKDGDMKVDGLTAGAVKQLADKGASLEISNPLAIYPVPGGKMDLSAVSKQLGNAALGDIAVHIDIARSSDTLITNAKNKAAAEGYELLVTPVDLDMTFSHDGKMVRTGQLNGYAAKYIALPEGIDPNRITTGVIVNPDGSVFHVPTVVTKINSRYYALIKDLRSNGSYSVIWNPQDFDDVKSHWGKADVNNIAARLDLAGTGNNTFSPDRNVTRSEFSEIVVAGLGLKRQNAPQNKFPDVSDSAWYRSSVAIANEFDIVRGYEDGNFYGDRQITREQGMAMIARAYKLIETKAALSQEQTDALLAKYEDAKKVSAWAREDIALMIEAGIVQGNGPQLLSPQSNMTRAEVTALIARLLKTTNLIDK